MTSEPNIDRVQSDHVKGYDISAWRTSRLGDLVQIINGYSFDSDSFSSEGWPLIRIRDLNQGVAETRFNGFAVAAAIVTQDDVLVGMDGDFNVGRWKSAEPALLNQRMLALRGPRHLLTVLEYALERPLRAINDTTYATTVKHLSSGQVRAIRLCLPTDPKDIRALAVFLDRETGQIDAFIRDQQELIELLQERRSAVLSHATLGRSDYVVRGHLGYFLRKLDRRATSGLGVVTAFRDGTVTSRSNRREEGFTFSNSEAGYQGVHKGDLVFHGLDGFSGAAGVSDSAGNCSPVYHVCYPSKSVNAAYAALYLRALGTSGFLAAYAWSVRQRSVDYRNWQVFSRLPLEFPAVSAQLETVVKVREHLSEIDAAIADARAAMELSAERRSALISAAVTGKIDVLERVGV